MYQKRGRIGDIERADDQLNERENIDNAITEFVKIFEEVTGNEFEPGEREWKFEKKPGKFYPLDMVYINAQHNQAKTFLIQNICGDTHVC